MNEEIKGEFLYQGKHTTSQVPYIKDYFTNLLLNENFDTIIELGTHFAGLTYIIDDICVENNLKKNIHTLDYAYRDYVETYLNERNISYHILDETKEEYKTLVKKLINEGGKTLLLCDGGFKIKEFNYYSDFIKNGDIIMAHDYAINEDIFKTEIKDKIWNWFEIGLSDIENAVNINNLTEYNKIDFKQAAWGCFVK